MEKLSLRQSQIIKLIKSDNYITANELSKDLNISIRTIKTEISNINHVIEKTGIKISSKSNKGYILNLNNQDKDVLMSLFPKNTFMNRIPETYYERVLYVIKKLLVSNDYIKLDDVLEELFISKTTMSIITRDVRRRLSKYRLGVYSKPNYGTIIKGEEKDRRLAIAEYFFSNTLNNDEMIFSDLDTTYIKEDIIEILSMLDGVFKEYGIEMSEYSLDNFAIHLYILIKRVEKELYVTYDCKLTKEIIDTIEYKASIKIAQKIEMMFAIKLIDSEIYYISEHIRSKRIIIENSISNKQEELLNKCLNLIMIETNNNFGLNLTSDSEWYSYMRLHIPLMVERLKNHIVIKNPLVKDNMRRYLFATKVTHSACEVIKQVYGVNVDINEFGYLLLYFNLEISRFEVNKYIKIGVISGRGRPESIMLANEIIERFSSNKYRVYKVDKDKIDDYDLVISTYDLKTDNENIMVITRDNYLDNVEEKLNEIRYKNLDINLYLKEEYCTFNLDGETKEEVELNIYKELYKKELINEIPKKYNRCLEDELGNGIVHFQDSYRILRKNMFYIFTLKKAVYWDRELVRIIILTKTKKENDKDLYNLCRLVSRWANDKYAINKFLKNQNFNELKDMIKTFM